MSNTVFTLGEIAEILGAELYHANPLTPVTGGVEFDSRKITPGALFIALPGEKTHGENFIQDALSRGACAIISTKIPAKQEAVPSLYIAKPSLTDEVLADESPVDRAKQSQNLHRSFSTASGVLEADHDGTAAVLLMALGMLARAYHAKFTARGLNTIAITGSVGKTTAKDTTAQLLAAIYGEETVLWARGSVNNELGVPWLLTHLRAEHKYVVVEMGARHMGDIAYLCSIAPPTIAIELGVISAHIGEFGSREAIARTKAELIAELPASAIAILNANDSQVMAMATRAKIITYGQNISADFSYQYRGISSQGYAEFSLRYEDCNGSVSEICAQSPYVGEHLLANLVAAIAAVSATGADLEAIISHIPQLQAISPHRMQLHELSDGTVIIDDAYNANPEAMHAALRFLAELGRKRRNLYPDLQTWAVIGEMSELGETALAAHDAVGRYAVRLNIAHLLCVGTSRMVNTVYQSAIMEGSWGDEALIVADVHEASRMLNDNIRVGDIILVKASHTFALWRIVERLLGDIVL